MTQKMMIDIVCDKRLQDYGDGHLLVYDKDKNNYFISTREEFLKPQNDKINDLENKFKALQKNLNNSFSNLVESINKVLDESKNQQNEFTKNTNQKFNEFLENYKQTNQKIIDLIKPLIAKEN